MKGKRLFLLLAVVIGFSALGWAKDITIGVTIYKFDDTFMTAVRNTIADTAKAAGVKADIVDAQNSQANCNDKVDLFITKKYDALAINLVDRTAASVIYDKALKAKKPVVFFNKEPIAEELAKWKDAYYVGAKAEQSGTMEGQLVVDYFKAHPTKDGVIKYVMLKGEPGHQDAELRTKYSIETIVKAGFKV
jgi:methyl-galactoside transport system substrate-binding protein